MTVIIEEMIVQTKLVDNTQEEDENPITEIEMLKQEIILLKRQIEKLSLNYSQKNYER